MPRISIGDVSLNYELSGSGQWLVLVHEIGGTLHTWSAVAQAMSPRFRVLRYDQRGAGGSDPIRGAFSIDTHVTDLRELLDELGPNQPVHLVGVAIGSAIALRCAARFPLDVKSLVLACPALTVSAERKDYLQKRAAQVEREGMGATVDSTLDNSYPAAFRNSDYGAYRARFLQNDPQSYAAINRAFMSFDAGGDCAQAKCPTLVLAGKQDKLRPPDAVKKVAGQIPGARYAEIHSGHIMPMQAPAEMVAEMNQFYGAFPAKP
jgi:3-oxoadipate enol-lactonase